MKLKNSFGFTLIELLATAILATILSIGFATAMYQYVLSFQESKDYIKLQQDMIDTINFIRHGYIKRNLNLTEAMIGLLSAQDVKISLDGQTITIIPLDGRGSSRYYARFSRNRNGTILLTAQHGHVIGNNIMVFPSKLEYVGREAKYQITRLSFENLTPDLEKMRLVKISMTGRVRFRERGRRQTQLEDLQNNIRYAQFETTVFIGNADKQ